MQIEKIIQKGIFTIKPGKTIKDALIEMENRNVSALPVVNNSGNILGIISVQDIAAACVPEEFKDNPAISVAMEKPGFFTESCQMVGGKKVSEIMRKDFLKVTNKSTVMAVMTDFLNNDLYHVPVVDENDKLIAIIGRNDIKKALLSRM